MLRIAILESEEVAKEIIFSLGEQLQDEDWTFQYFTRLSAFAKAQSEKEFQIVFFQDKFDTPRICGTFVHPYLERIVVFTTEEKKLYEHEISNFERILYINRTQLRQELERITPYMKKLLINQEKYFFSYNSISVPLKISEIYYIEKVNKNLIYHTKRGEFSERKSMKTAEEYFDHYGFIRIHASFLVNMQYITKFGTDEVYVRKSTLPIARNRKQQIREKVKSYIGNS